MEMLNRITIKSRMVLKFVLMVLLFVFLGLFSIDKMNELGALTSELYEHPLKVSSAALRAKAGVLRMHRSMKDVAMSQDEFQTNMAFQAVLSEEKLVYQNLGIVKERILGPEGKALVQQTIDMFAGWKPIRVEVEELVLKGERKAAGRITRSKGADYVVRLERKMDELTSYAAGKADDFMKDAEHIQSRVLRNTSIIIIAAAFLSLLITFLMTSSILSSVSALKSTMAGITATGSLVKAKITGNNEITEMSRHFNALVERLQEQFWLRDGQNAVNQELSGELSYDELVTRSINFVSRYVDACTGALYTYNEKRSLCELKSSFAFVEKKHLFNEFKLGEGIVGQVAVEKSPILLANITREEAVGTTGTVSEPPKSIYTIPLVHEKELYGVLEVASFEDIDNVKREFLDSAANIISVSLFTASQNERIKGLLESTQETNEKLQAQTEELEAQTEELQAMNEESQQQAEELQEQNVELETQRQQVEEANRLKSEFLSNMSHELRTPLNSVMALSRVLIMQAKEKLSQEEAHYLEIIERNGKQLLNLINDILDLSKIEAGRMDVNPRLFSPKSAIETILESLEALAEDKGIEVIQKIPDDLPKIESDESRVHQILQNIIGNAVKFTNQGSVTVSASNDVEKVYVRIKDTGIGISEKDQRHIFDEFRQADGSSARLFEGTGLGLTIAYKATKMLGGDISVESALGQGATFALTLPIKWEGLAQIYEPGAVTLLAQTTPEHPQTRDFAKDARILLVEDNEAVHIQVKAVLESENYIVAVAENGQEAIEYVRHTIPDGIILDLMMPGVDGFEVLEKIRSTAATAGIPVLVLTAKDLTPDDLNKLSANNIQQLIHKGDVDRQSLLFKIELMLGSQPGLKPQEKILRPAVKIKPLPKTSIAGTATVLVIEDNPDNLITIKAVLQSRYNILEASDGEEGLKKTLSEKPDLVLLDMSLPKLDGFTVVKKVKEDQNARHIPVIALTACAMKGDREKILEAGCDDYISKPIDPRKILEKVDKWLGG